MLPSGTPLVQVTIERWSRWFFWLGLIGVLLPSVVSGAQAWNVVVAQNLEERGEQGGWTENGGDGLQGVHLLLTELNEGEEPVELEDNEEEVYPSNPSGCLPLFGVLAPFGIDTGRATKNAEAVRADFLARGPKPYSLHHSWKLPTRETKA